MKVEAYFVEKKTLAHLKRRLKLKGYLSGYLEAMRSHDKTLSSGSRRDQKTHLPYRDTELGVYF